MRKYQFLFIISFISLLFLPLIFFNHQDDFFSSFDNRYLRKKEEVYDHHSYSLYFNDRIGFRKELIALNVNFNSLFLNYIAHNDYIYGKNGYIFFKPKGKIKFNDYHKSFINMVSEIAKYLQSQNIPFYFVLEPSKNLVYSEYLPDSFNDDNSFIDELITKLKQKQVNVINNIETLNKYKAQAQVFDKKNNPYHWNGNGTFYGAFAIVDAMMKDFKKVKPLTKEDFIIETKTIKTALNDTLIINEDTDIYHSKTKYQDLSDVYRQEVYLDDNFPYFFYLKQIDNTDLPKVLIFEGSYFIEDNKNTYLIKNSSELIGVQSYQNILRFKEFYEKFKPDCVIFEVVDYTLVDHFFNSYVMERFSLSD